MSEPTFWNDNAKAQAVVSELKGLKALVSPFLELEKGVNDNLDLLDLAAEEGDEKALEEVARESEALFGKFAAFETLTLLSDPHDRKGCFVMINPGAGGTESCDWAEMLLRMLTRFCEKQGYRVSLQDVQKGEEAGIKSATLHV
ncbi:MAG: PCRF domain-containing protein, partial [Planctomycetota bacterium]